MSGRSANTGQSEIADHVRHLYELTYEPGTHRIALAADVHLSADGAQVAFTGTVVDDLDGASGTRICLVAGGKPKSVSTGQGDRHPRWSPDGRTLAYLEEDRDTGRPRVVVLDVRTGAATRATSAQGTVEWIKWCADARTLLLGVAGERADLGDTQALPEQGGRRAGSPEPPLVRDPNSEAARRTLCLMDVVSGEFSFPNIGSLNVWEAAWCGDAAVVVVASQGTSEGAWFQSELWWVPLTGGEPKSLLRSADQMGVPEATRDGSRVAIIEGTCSDRGNVAGAISTVTIDTGVINRLSSGGVDVTSFDWLDDDRIAFLGVRGMRTVAGMLSTVSGPTGATTWELPGSCGRHVPAASFARSTGAMAVVHDAYSTYPEVLVLHAGVVVERCSLAPAGFETLRILSGRSESVLWTATDGLEIEGMLCLPDRSGPHPMVVFVHGGPVGVTTDAWNMGNDVTRLLVSRGFAVLHPNPRGSYGRGQEFVQRVLGDLGGADARDLLSGVTAMIGRGAADANRIGIAGTSYGGFMAAWLPSRTGLFSAAVSMSPVTDWHSLYYTSNIPEFVRLFVGADPIQQVDTYRACSPMTYVGQVTAPTLLVTGLRDLCTPAEQPVRFHNALAMHGVETTMVTYPDEGHGVRNIASQMDLAARVVAWFEKYLV